MDFKKELEKKMISLVRELDGVRQERDDLLERLATTAKCENCNVDLSYWTQGVEIDKKGIEDVDNFPNLDLDTTVDDDDINDILQT